MINDDNYSRYILCILDFETSGKFVGMDIISHCREYQRMRRKFNYESLLHESGGRMFGEISRTGKDRLNVKGGGGGMNVLEYGRSS